jgi:hypothetical protein
MLAENKSLEIERVSSTSLDMLERGLSSDDGERRKMNDEYVRGEG